MAHSRAGKNSSPLIMCNCQECRKGRNKYKIPLKIDKIKRKFRHQTKAALRNGLEPPTRIYVGYTDIW